MFGFDVLWLVLVGLSGAFPFDFVGLILTGASRTGFIDIGLNPMTVVLLMVLGLFLGLLVRNGEFLSGMFTSQDDPAGAVIKALFISGLIGLISYVLLGKFAYSLSLDSRHIGVGMLANAIMILLGSMIKKGRKEYEEIKIQDGVSIGIASLLSFFPGVGFLAALFLVLRIRGFNYRAVAQLSFLSLMINVVTFIVAYFILFPGYFDFNGSLLKALVIVVLAAVMGFISTFGYEFVLNKKMPKLLALISFVAGLILVFF